MARRGRSEWLNRGRSAWLVGGGQLGECGQLGGGGGGGGGGAAQLLDRPAWLTEVGAAWI